jgi:Mitochondrial ribosomal protein (VAR1)
MYKPLKFNELKKLNHLTRINETNKENYSYKNNLSFLKKTKSFPIYPIYPTFAFENLSHKSKEDRGSIQLLEESNNKTKGSIVLHRLNNLLNLTNADRSRLAETRGNLSLSIKKTNIPNLSEGNLNETEQLKLLSKGENTTLELLKISEIKKESLLNKTGIIQLFYSKGNSGEKNSSVSDSDSDKNTIIYKYLNNNLQRISPIADINTQQKNGILFNYSKTIAYNFLNTSTNDKIGITINSGSCSKDTNNNIINSNINSNSNSLNLFFKANSNKPSVGRGGGIYYEAIDINKDLFKINKLLFYFFKSLNCLISKPVYLHTPDKVIIELFYFLNIPKKKVFRLFSILYYNSFRKKWLSKKSQIFSLNIRKNSLRNKRINTSLPQTKKKIPFIKRKVRKAISRLRGKSNIQRSLLFNLRKINLGEVFISKFQIIIEILTRKFNKPVVFQITRIHNPYFDSNILVNLLSLNIRNKRKKSRIAINTIYSNKAIKNSNEYNLKSVNLIPAFLSGLNLKIGGRLMQEPIIPRLTTKNFERGATSPGKVNYLDIANITKKNKKGANTITIKSAQKFFL